jgi:hypothetical protein
MEGLEERLALICVFMVEVMGVFCYFSGFPDDARMVHLDVRYVLCSVEVGSVFGLCHI